MPIGILATPDWFQDVTSTVLDAGGVDAASDFLDNITIGGTPADFWQCWEAMLRVIKKLT